MGAPSQPVVLAYWAIVVLCAAFCLRLICGLMREDIPSWRRSVASVLIVTFFAYVAFDFSAYLIMRSMDGVLLHVPPGYAYTLWFREPLPPKLFIIGHAGPVRYLPYVFALCAAGFFQVLALQAQVTFRIGLVIALLQTAGAALSAYLAALVFGLALVPPGGDAKGTASAALPLIEDHAKDAVEASTLYLHNAGKGLKSYADTHLDDLKEELGPVTRQLPQSVQTFLEEDGGWWIILGVLAGIALLWARSQFRKLRQAGRRAKKKKGKKKKSSKPTAPLVEELVAIGDAYTDEGPQRVLVNSLPARLRLVVLSQGNKNPGGLSEEMADRVLDWIKHGLAETTAGDYPRVRVWPPFYDPAGFATAVSKNVVIPEAKGTRSHWIVVAGRLEMGLSIINVALGFYAEEESTARHIVVRGDRWLEVIGVEKPQVAGRR